MIQKIHLTLLFLFISMHTIFAQVLDKKVTIQFQNISIEQALKKIKITCGVNFSYSPDQVDLSKSVNFYVQNESLRNVLNKLFKSTYITYRAVGNQIVLKKEKGSTIHYFPPVKSASIKPIAILDSITPIPPVQDSLIHTSIIAIKPLEVIFGDTVEIIKKLDDSYSKGLTDLNSYYVQKKDSVAIQSFLNNTQLKKSYKQAKHTLEEEYKQLRDSIMYAKQLARHPQNPNDTTTIEYSQDLLIQDNFQFTGIYPLATHGLTSGLYRNDYSLNALVGYNGAVSKFEYAGVANIVRREVQGIQMAGITNIAGEYVRGAQFAGIANITNQELIGGQFAGIVNIANAAANGVQAAGIVNIGTEQLDGVQIAGVINQHNGTVNGGQIGLINHAHKVKGFQLGLINICDTIHGVPFGLLSISKNGYSKVEAYYSETTRANILIKSGVTGLYNIFEFGINYNSANYRWTFGYGIGSMVHMSKNSTISFDLIAMHINEDDAFTNKMNEEGQLRIMLGLKISKRVSFFAGPTFNTSFSKFTNSSGGLGSKIIPRNAIVYQKTIKTSNGDDIYNPYWLGFNAGIRF
jgi:hypothetical protein